MKNALLIIDYTNDFVADGGALTCGEPAQGLDMRISALCKRFMEHGDVFTCVDTHEKNDKFHPESRLFPPHNIKGTHGWEMYGETAEAAKNAVLVEKSRYSAFAGTSLDNMLRARKITGVMLTGVCTDICVLHTAISAYNLGYEVTVVSDCVASFDEGAHEFALKHMKNTLGARVCGSTEV